VRALRFALLLLALPGCGVEDAPAANEAPPPRPAYYSVGAPPDAPARGPKDALVTIVVFSDFQAARAAGNARALAELGERFGRDLRIVYRGNPQPRNPDARRAELAARAAARQGRFWQMHDALFAAGKLGETNLLEAAGEVGCDVARLEADMSDPSLAAAVAADRQAALELGLTTSPFNFVNGRPLEAIRFVDDAAVIVREELDRARRLAAEAPPGTGPYAAIIAGGATRLPGTRQSQPTLPDPTARYRVPVDGAVPALGPDDAPVTIVAFVDLECPFSASTFRALAKLQAVRAADVRIAVRHLPLPTRPGAALAAEAAVEAHAQGKLWRYLDLVFTRGGPMDRGALVAVAAEAGMDIGSLEAALTTRAHGARVEIDRALAASLGLRDTPQLFFNGLARRGSHSFDQLTAIVDRELALALALPATPPDAGVRTIYERLTDDGATAPVHLEPGSEGYDPAVVSDGTHRIHDVAVPPDAPAKGAPDAPVTIVEFGDYQCGMCARMEPIVEDLVRRHAPNVSAVFRHFPLPGHEHARLAAQAAVEAAEQGRFWEYHARLMANPGSLSLEDLVAHARAAGLDADRMRAALEDRRHEERVSRDVAEARRLGLAGTPSFFVNGRKPTGNVEADLEALVERLSPAR
jgi:protein-disulfide isomerase